MSGFAQWLGATPLSIAIQKSDGLVAGLQAIHILMLGVVFVSMLMIALHALGRIRADQSPSEVWTRFAPWLFTGLAVMAATGVVLIIGEPVRQASALSFWLKMVLLVLAVAGVLRLRHRSSRPLAWAVIATWVVIVFLGRAIAYDVEVWGSWSLVN
jgi:uncharacterized membrane protein SirB2